MPCLDFWSVVFVGFAPALLVFLYWAILIPTATLLFWALAAPFIAVSFAMHADIACLHFACWDSLSGFALACCDSLSGFPCLQLAVADWHLSKGVCL